MIHLLTLEMKFCQAFKHKPDVTFLIGDNIYADTYSGIYLGNTYPVKPRHLWNRI